MNPKEKKNQKQTAKKNNSKKWLFIGLGTAATAALSYFGWQYWKNNKSQTADENNDTATTNFREPAPKSYAPKAKPAATPADSFPLKKGSKGENVKNLQAALIANYGKTILPKYGADGEFGSELTTALTKVGLPNTIDETTFNVIVKGSSPDPASTASQLYNAVLRKDYNKVIVLLKTIRNANDYKAVSNVFTSYRINGVRQTLVNGVLNSFSDAKQKQGIQLAFSNMGLKYDGNKWALAGIDTPNILITNRPSKVWRNSQTSVNVPANMVLGKELTKRKNYTLFENDKQYFLIESADVNYYQ